MTQSLLRLLTWGNEKLCSTPPCEFSPSSRTSTVWQLFAKWASSFSHLSACWRAWIHSVGDLPLREPINAHTESHRPPRASLWHIPFSLLRCTGMMRFGYSHLGYERLEEPAPQLVGNTWNSLCWYVTYIGCLQLVIAGGFPAWSSSSLPDTWLLKSIQWFHYSMMPTLWFTRAEAN